MELIINIFLGILGIYFIIGLLFALYFIIKGATKIDPLMQDTKKRVRFLLLPGVIVTWPFLIVKLFKSKTA
ncbi:hypothetical protein GCM10023311_05780 [Flaviramulus aquimarinus]|uniref:Cardiolipin synthase N-terminal domain-containing protein n=1 Tax=Flaviramulus aquimarinus TaxID=1170456 RepID=A0ABP9EUV3_9FLAO